MEVRLEECLWSFSFLLASLIISFLFPGHSLVVFLFRNFIYLGSFQNSHSLHLFDHSLSNFSLINPSLFGALPYIMRFIVPTFVGLAAVVSAQFSNSTTATGDCVSQYTSCLDNGGADNTCNANLTSCKNTCSDSYGSCLSASDADDAQCMSLYNSCLDLPSATTVTSTDCVSTFHSCVDSGEAENTCNAGAASCKNKCANIYGTCLSSGGAVDAVCMSQYNNCLVSPTTSTASASSTPTDCVSKYTACEADDGEDNTCEADNAQCKVSALV